MNSPRQQYEVTGSIVHEMPTTVPQHTTGPTWTFCHSMIFPLLPSTAHHHKAIFSVDR